MTLPMRWTWRRFDDLSARELHAALALRCRVFILEQGPYQDPDDLDQHAWHLLGHAPHTEYGDMLLATLRLVEPGRKYAEPSLGRVVCAPEIRGRGVGHALVAEGLAQSVRLYPGQAVRISAQAHLKDMYARLGFEPASQEYLEDDIPHLEMLCEAVSAPQR